MDSDIIISKVIKDKDGFQTIHAKFMTINEHHNVTGNDIPYLYYYLGPGGKFIKRELIIKNDILFPNNLHFGEDKMFFMEIFSKARSITTVPTISTYVNRSVDNTSLVRKSDFVTKRHSDFVLFKSVLNINDIKFKNKFLVRILEYDLLNNCNSNVFLKLGQDEKEEVFKVIRKIFTHEIITEEIIDLLDKKYNDAILAIYNNDLEKFIQFFNWYRKGIKIISSRDSNLYYYV
ncbi:glycosyltransferase family 2 protein, partial [Staphylococcus borealis]